MTPDIVQKNNPVLRKEAKLVKIDEIKSPKIQKIISDMKKALASQDDGVAIAAPQIGVSLQIFIVSHKVFETSPNPKDEVYINPKIVKASRKKIKMEEGCLSVRGLYGETERHEKATVSAYDENGSQFTKGGSGLLAQIYQHETDHLKGILFTDSAVNLKEYE